MEMAKTKTKTKTKTTKKYERTNDTNGFIQLLIHLINVHSAAPLTHKCAMCSFSTFVMFQPFTISQIILNTLPRSGCFFYQFGVSEN